MKKFLIPLSLLLLLATVLATSAWAVPLEDLLAAQAADAKGDYATELKIIRPLAVQGVPFAQTILGLKYVNGQGVVQDYTEAAKWFRLAAAQGHDSAQHDLAIMYDNGQGVVQNYAEAVKWYRLAAAQGYTKAQYNLGLRYAKGQGVVQDYIRAHMWFNLAAVSGLNDAAKNRDIAASKMTSQQIGEAQKRARECQARQFKNCD